MDKRFTFPNLEVMRELEAKDKSVVLMCGHYASYEWLISLNSRLTYKGFAIYKKINNKYFNKLVIDIRSKFKANLIDTKDTFRIMYQNKKEGILATYGFASDQSPMLGKALYWRSFMGVEVPIHIGAEVLAKQLDMNMIYVKIQKTRRGYYTCTFVPLAENVRTYPDYEITDLYLRLLEEQIYKQPEYYLWTHNRWKHKDKKPLG